MSDHLSNLATYSPWIVPLIFLLFGVTSSLHCVGMCGPLSLLAAQGSRGSWLYQTGRLIGYLTIGTVLSFLGRESLNWLLLKVGTGFWYLLASVVVVSLTVALLTKMKFSSPRLVQSFSQRAMGAALRPRNRNVKSFAIGLSSVFLPCGILYLAVISLVALGSPGLSAAGIVFFWIGTLPLLHFGLPTLRQLLNRFSLSARQINAVVVILLCALVLFGRYPHVIREAIHHCH